MTLSIIGGAFILATIALFLSGVFISKNNRHPDRIPSIQRLTELGYIPKFDPNSPNPDGLTPHPSWQLRQENPVYSRALKNYRWAMRYSTFVLWMMAILGYSGIVLFSLGILFAIAYPTTLGALTF